MTALNARLIKVLNLKPGEKEFVLQCSEGKWFAMMEIVGGGNWTTRDFSTPEEALNALTDEMKGGPS